MSTVHVFWNIKSSAQQPTQIASEKESAICLSLWNDKYNKMPPPAHKIWWWTTRKLLQVEKFEDQFEVQFNQTIKKTQMESCKCQQWNNVILQGSWLRSSVQQNIVLFVGESLGSWAGRVSRDCLSTVCHFQGREMRRTGWKDLPLTLALMDVQDLRKERRMKVHYCC